MNSTSSTQKARHKLRVTMKDGGYSASRLSRTCGLSRSLIEKLMSQGSKKPSIRAVITLETTLGCRLWSSPSEYKARTVAAAFEETVKSLALAEGINEASARQLASERLPNNAFALSSPTSNRYG